jgi:hypothetical protein
MLYDHEFKIYVLELGVFNLLCYFLCPRVESTSPLAVLNPAMQAYCHRTVFHECSVLFASNVQYMKQWLSIRLHSRGS